MPEAAEAVTLASSPRAEARPQTLRVRAVDVGCRALLRVSGPLDVVTAPALGEALEPFRRRGQHLILDLRGAEYIETPALRLLLGLCADLRAAQGQLCLVVEPGSRVERTLRLADMEQQCGLCATVREAWSWRERQAMAPAGEPAGGAA
jgi:anti-anti-sigma factor